MRSVAAVSISLLLLLLQLTTLYSTAQAGANNIFRNLDGLLPRNKNKQNKQNKTDSSDFCSASDVIAAEVERALYPLQYRGGYKDEVAVQEAEAGVLTDEGRLDEAAKSKVYGKLEFPLFQKGDGSDEDPDGIPTRYLRMQLHRRELAKKAAKATLDWREEHEIDSILKRPHPDFDVAKAVFPHYFVTRDVGGHVVFVQRPALVNLKLAEKNGLNNKALLDHYVYVNEYLWQIVEAADAMATMTSIIDLQGLNLSVLRQADLMTFMKEFIKTMDSHYPQRANKTLIVNVPKWFHLLYKIVSPLIRESTKAKIEIHSRGKRQDKALKSWLGNDAEKVLPESFFKKKKGKEKEKEKDNSKNDEEDGDDEELPVQDTHVVSQLEGDLRSFTIARLQEAGLKMQEVVPV